VLLGNGDGTFRPIFRRAAAPGPSSWRPQQRLRTDLVTTDASGVRVLSAMATAFQPPRSSSCRPDSARFSTLYPGSQTPVFVALVIWCRRQPDRRHCRCPKSAVGYIRL
jgi:hypothetical protein